MTKKFKRGDRVRWNSEAGMVRGKVTKKLTSNVTIKGYTHHASKNNPQYMIRSEKTNHIAVHKGSALQHIPPKKTRRGSKGARRQARR